MASLVLIRLAALTGEGRYREAAERALAPLAVLASEHPTAFAQWLLAYQLASFPINEIAVIGSLDASDTQALLATAVDGYRPSQVVAASADASSSAVPLLSDRTALDGAATAYVCQGFACQRPTTDPSELAKQLTASAS